MKYVDGDVLIAHVPYEDGTGLKIRPVIVLKIIPEKERYVIAECYSDKENYGKNFGILIKQGTQLYNELGFDKDTFITSSIKAIYEKVVIKKIGHYNDIFALKTKLKTC
jgi:hypothetical protein